MGKAKGPRQKSIPKLDNLENLLEKFQESLGNLDKLDGLDNQLTLSSSNEYKLDTDKIETLEDVKLVLKAMDMTIYWPGDQVPEKFKTILERGFLKEIKNENI